MNIWTSKIRELEAAGMSLVEIGREVGLTASGVSDIKQGRTQQPRGDAALKLDALHRTKCKQIPTQAAA